MGNPDLREIAAIESMAMDDIAGSTLAIDTHNWLYRYLTIVVRYTNSEAYTTSDGTEVANLIGIVQGVSKLLEHDITPVFVFDGIPTDLKEDEIKARRKSRKQREEQLETAKEEGDQVEIARLQSQTQRLTPTILETSRELLSILDCPVVEAPAEGEAQAAHMAKEGAVDGVGSEDYDTLLFGAPITYRKLTSSGNIERMNLSKTLEKHDISFEQLVAAGILCGTDFNDGVHGFGPRTAIKAIKKHGTLDAVLEANDVEVPMADRIQSLFRDPTVTSEYNFDKSVAPDVDVAREYLTSNWEIEPTEIERSLERITTATQQTGLDDWT